MKLNLTTIKNLIQQGELQNAIFQLTEITNEYSSRYHNEVILHTASLKEVQDNERKGLLSPEEIRREKNRIVYALLDLINVIEQEIATKHSTVNLYKPKILSLIHI